MRHFLEVTDLRPEELLAVLEASGAPKAPVLTGKGTALIFEKPSARTRNSAEMAVFQLGGHPAYITQQEIGFDARESVEDVTRTLEGYYSVLCARVFSHSVVERMAGVAKVPVINLLSDIGHPVQALADLRTIQEHVKPIDQCTLAWVGDFSNVARSLCLGVLMLGGKVRICCPVGYGPSSADVAQFRALAAPYHGSVDVVSDINDSVRGVDVVSTDAWYSMGQEEEKEIRAQAFDGFRVDSALMNVAGSQAYFLHCLPAHREQEVTSDVLDSPRSLIWPQAHNRMHTFRGLLLWLSQQGAIQ